MRRGVRVAQVKLHDLVVVQHRADGERAARRVHADEVADQKVAVPILLPILGHHDAEEQRAARQLLIRRAQAFEELLEHLDRRPAVELPDEVAVALGDEHRLADRPAALRDDGVHLDVAAQRDADQAGAVDVRRRGTARWHPAAARRWRARRSSGCADRSGRARAGAAPGRS